MTRLRDAIRKKYDSPESLLRALGMDSALVDTKGNNAMTTKKPPTRFAKMALDIAIVAVKPLLAKDATIDLMPVFKDLTSKNYDSKKVFKGMQTALKGKLAADAEMGMHHVAKILDHIEAPKSNVSDESVNKAQHNAMEAAAHGHSNLGIPKDVGEEFSEADKGKTFDAEGVKNFLRENGMSEDDVHHLMDMMGHDEEDIRSSEPEVESSEKDEDSSMHDFGGDQEFEKTEKELEKKAGEADLKDKVSKDKKGAKDKGAKDKKAMDSEMVSKQAMDAAIRAAIDATTKRERGIRLALDEVKPWVGDLRQAFDTAEAVKRQALKMLGVDGADQIHESALSQILSMCPKPGARPVERGSTMASDSADQMTRFFEKYPDAKRVGVGNC